MLQSEYSFHDMSIQTRRFLNGLRLVSNVKSLHNYEDYAGEDSDSLRGRAGFMENLDLARSLAPYLRKQGQLWDIDG